MPEPKVEQLGPCPDLSLIAAYVDGRLTDSERDSLHRHLALCDLCTELVTEVVAANAMDVAPVAAPRVAAAPEPIGQPAPGSLLPFFRRHRAALTGTFLAVTAALVVVVRVMMPRG